MKQQPILLSHDEHYWRNRAESCFYEGARFVGTKGEHIQVIAKGEWHQRFGPDIVNMALLINGILHVGNAEFHKRASDWFAHKHQDNPAYQALVAHIVCEHDTEESTTAHATIIVSEDMMIAGEEQSAILSNTTSIVSNSHTLMVARYAVARLERKAQELMPLTLRHHVSTTTLLRGGIEEFAQRLSTKRTRHTGIGSAVDELLRNERALVLVAHIMDELLHEEAMLLRIQGLLTTYISQGATIEIMTNVVAPLLLAHLPVFAQDRVWAWWWSAQTTNTYSILTKRFPALPQRYVWQQQGLLEMLKAPHGATLM